MALVALVHVFAAAMVFGAYHFTQVGNHLVKDDSSKMTPSPVAIINSPIQEKKGDVGIRVVRHRVKDGESYWSISKKYGITIKKLMACNGHDSNHVLKPDEEIRIPSN